jgi:hypothetical protein
MAFEIPHQQDQENYYGQHADAEVFARAAS